MPRKQPATSSTSPDTAPLPPPSSSSSPQTQTHSTSQHGHTQAQQSQNIQATEQQLKARAEGGVSIEDYLLPRSLTLRLAKSVLPPNTTIQKDAVLAIQKAATVFVSYLSSHANEATLKRTVAPSDVFAALTELELDSFRPRLEQELEMYTELKAGKRRGHSSQSQQQKQQGQVGGVGLANKDKANDKNGNENENGEDEDEEMDGVRGSKRVKVGASSVTTTTTPTTRKTTKESGADSDGDETQDDPGMMRDENETEVDEDVEDDEQEEDDEEEEEDEEEDEEEEGDREGEDIDRVEDLDREHGHRAMDPDAGDETESDNGDDGPGGQLRGDLGLG